LSELICYIDRQFAASSGHSAVALNPTDWTKGGPWVMWKGTPYAHIMVPTTSMGRSTTKMGADKK
jgi:hypothetical protein